MACTYTLIDANGKQITLNGPAEFKAYLVESGLKQFYPDGKYPWSSKEAAKIKIVKQQPEESGNDTRQNQAKSQRDSGIRANNQFNFGQTNQESVENPTPENVGKAAKRRNNERPSADSAGSNVGIGGTVRESGTATNRRAGTSGKRLANDGVGEERRNASSVESQRGNYHIDDPDTLIGGTPKVRFARNKKAIEAYQSITSEGRAPTQDELDAMAAYIGWGSFGQELFQGSYDNPRPKDGWKDESEWLREHLGKADWESAQASIINAHYTDPITVSAMWDMVSQLGFKGGRTLEPSMGIGNFYGLMPKALAELSTLTGIEMDSLTGGMAKILYPDANIQIKPYQDSKTADGFYDLVIGNWPFAKDGPADRRYMRLSPSLHDYFFLKALDQTRAGGLVVGITSAGTMDKKGTLTRAALAEKADLVAAFRLPSGAFEKYAGTSVVTDIIILKKRDTPNADVKASGWLNTAEVNTPSGNKVTVNEYFANNPDKVLGTLNFGHGTTYGRPAMVVNRPDDLETRLKSLAKTLPTGVFEPMTTKAKTTQYITNNTTDRQQSITEQGGKLYQVQGEYLAPLDDVLAYKVKDANKTADRLQQIKDLVEMRRAYGELIDAEREGNETTETKRKALRDAYNAFTKANGPLADSYGLSALKKVNDPFYPSLAALEMPDGSPSAILSKPTIRAKRRLEKPSVRDALVLARNESINLDMDRVAELSGVPVDEAAKQLMDSGAIFKTPDGNYEVSDVYLSGNVRRKLREAQDAEDHGVDMKRNIEALKNVLPPDVPYFNIEAKLGATWIRPEQYGEFIAHLLGVKPSNDIEVRWAVNRWKVSFHDKTLSHKPEATTTWGHTNVKFDKLLNAAMGNVAVKVQYKDQDGNLQTDEAATAEANNKAQQIREEFANWLWSDPVRKIEMERTYNEVMNAIALPSYDGSFLSFEGMALQRGDSPFNLRQHQTDAIWRGLANGRGLYAHEVGTGKTYTMGGIAVESRRYGIAKKPIIFAHNANSASVAREIGEMYPGAKLLYIDNLAPDRIAVTLRQIQSDDWDAVVVPHSLIDRFTLKKDTLMDLAREQIEALEQEAIEAAQEDGSSLDVNDMDDPNAMKKVRSATAKQLVHARNSIIKKIDDMALRSSREDAISFEDMGIDMVIVDEAHEFKKPPLATRMRMKGLNTQSSAQSISMMFLTDYVKKLNNGRGVHLFTGTPITNTMTEIYNQMRYVMDDQMSRDGIRDWDAWFNTFADSTSDVELTAAGEYEPITRLASFVNVAELRRMIGQYMDIVFAEDMPEFKPRETKSGKTLSSDKLTDKERNELLNGRTENPVGRPYKKVVSDIAEMTEQQKGILALLQQRANAFKNASKKERRKMMLSGSPNSPVIVETDSANAGLDARLFDINASDSPTSKVNRAVKRIMEHYDEHDLATQVVFVERGFTNESVSRKKDQATGKITTIKKARFNLVKDLVDKLVEQGIPANQIAIVDGSTTKEKRKAIADAMNRAEIRVVIGNTKTLGVGVNMQTNLRAMHHLDAPWMPGDLEQRNGRGHRQGNKWNTVMEYRYLTERIDGRRWQVLAVKDRFIKAFLKAKDDVRVIDGDAVSMDEEGDIGSTLAEAAGDPRLLMMNKLRGDVQKLEAKERMHSQGVFDAAQKIKSLGREIEYNSTRLAGLRADDDVFRGLVKDGLSFEVSGKQYDDAEKANEAIAKQVQRMEVGSNATLLGKAWGFDVYGYWPGRTFNAQYFIESGNNRYDMGKPTVESARATLYAIKGQAEKLEAKIADTKDSLPRMEEATKAPFARAADLEKKRAMLAGIEADIQINPLPAPAWLRNGAPVGSEALVGGKPVVIEGHRWTSDGYLVTVTEGEKTRDVDYLEVKDENGLPIYDVQPFAKPEIAETIENNKSQKYSKAEKTTGSTVAQIEKLLPNRVKKMLQAGKLEVVQSSSKNTEAYYDTKNDKLVLVADMLNKDNLETVLSHELYHRALSTDAKTKAAYDKFQTQINRQFQLARGGEGSSIEQRAAQRVIRANTPVENRVEEFTAYLVTEYKNLPVNLKKIIADFVASIRMTLLRHGLDMGFIKTLTPADLYALSRYGANAKAMPVSKAEFATNVEANIPETIDVNGVKRPTRNSNGQLIHQTQENIRNFWEWFGDSKIVDEQGRPIPMYHGTPKQFEQPIFRTNSGALLGKGAYFTSNIKESDQYANKKGEAPTIYSVYLKVENPKVTNRFLERVEKERVRDTNDGIQFNKPNTDDKWVVTFNPEQIKSLDNFGEFNAVNPDIRYSKQFTDLQNKAIDAIQNRIKSSKTFNKWHLTVGTQHHKALIDKDFGKVFNASLNLENDTARFANESADEAPSLLPKTESLQEVAKEVAGKGFKRIKDAKKIADAIFETTLNDSPMSDAELKAKGYSDEQRKMYKEFFAAVNHSLDELAKSELFRLARSMKLNLAPQTFSLHETADFYINQLTKDEDKELFNQKVEQIDKLQSEGYAPLMRFGRFTVDVVDKASGKREFFGMFETETEANEMAKVLAETYPDATISHGETSQKSWEMFKGVTPETMETIAKMMNAEQDEAFQLYLVQAINNRDAMKRLIHRKKIPGFAKDPQRILAAFITSNAKATSKNYNMGELVDAISHIPKDKGDVIDEAVEMYNFVQNPSESGSQIRGLLFAWYLGGSFASAMVNTTQTLTTTLPYLHQFGSTQQVANILGNAMKLAAKNPKTIGGDLGRALHRAEEEGVTAPHELHMLYGESMRTSLASNAMIRPLQKAWGSLFSLTEGYNRRTAFIAAYNLAKENKHQNPFEFAADAVNQTQFIYSKSSRPNWARGAVGSTLFTFKTFTINYLEFLKRLPMQERLIALGILILMSGLSGLPGSDDADDILDTIGQYLGYNTNTKEWKEKIVNDMLGKEAGQFALHGVSSFLPIDIGSRLSVGNVIPGTAILKKSETDKKRDVMEFFGAAGSLAEKGIQAFEASQGREGIVGKAQAIAHAALPKALSDAYQALDMVQTGYYRDYKGKNVQKVSEADALFKMLGLQPTKVSEPKQRERMIQQDIAMTKAVETDIADLWADGIYAKNQNKVKEAKEMLAEWNRKNPETPIKVKMSQIMKRVKAMKQTSGERLMKTAPKELRKFASESLND